MPPAQPYPDSLQYSGYNHHLNGNQQQATSPNVEQSGLLALPPHSGAESHSSQSHHYESSFDSDRSYTSSQVPLYHAPEDIPAVESAHQSGSPVEPRRPAAITLTIPQDHRSSPTMSASSGGVGCRIRDENSVSPQLSPRSASSNCSASSKRLLDLAPLRSLQRTHPYRRDKFDDRALSLLNSHR
jgi:hypothetical protein